MESKARRRKLSKKNSCNDIDGPLYFAAWLASKLRLRHVSKNKETNVVPNNLEIIDVNVIEGSTIIRG